jgi:hypothetical protein
MMGRLFLRDAILPTLLSCESQSPTEEGKRSKSKGTDVVLSTGVDSPLAGFIVVYETEKFLIPNVMSFIDPYASICELSFNKNK